MSCIFCKEKVERHHKKVVCGDCLSIFHCACVNLHDADIDYMKMSGKKYRCDNCSALRRKSLHLQQQNDVIQPNLAVSTHLQNDAHQQQQQLNISTQSQPSNSCEIITQIYAQTLNEQNYALQGEKLTDTSHATSQYSQITTQHTSGSENTCDLQISMQRLIDEVRSLKKVNLSYIEDMRKLQEDNLTLKKKVSSLETKINFIRQKEIRNAVEVTGVALPDLNQSNVVSIVQQIFADSLQLNVPVEDIHRVYIRKKNINAAKNTKTTSNNNNVICVHLKSLEKKQKIMERKRNIIKKNKKLSTNFSNSNSHIFINESMTSFNYALFKESKSIGKQFGYKYCWFKDMFIFLKKDDNHRPVRIRSFLDLDNIKSNT